MSNLKLPYASLSPFRPTPLVSVANADSSVPYYCPSCHVKLILREGDIRQKHFAHFSTSCSFESIVHLMAKSIILDIFNNGRFYDIRFPSKCPSCFSILSSHLVSFPSSVTHLELEHSYGGYVYDILCFSGPSPLFAIEVFHSHPVGSVKSLFSPVPIFEFTASDILSSPYLYPVPILHRYSWSDFSISADSCPFCLDRKRAAAERSASLAREAQEAREALELRDFIEKLHPEIRQAREAREAWEAWEPWESQEDREAWEVRLSREAREASVKAQEIREAREAREARQVKAREAREAASMKRSLDWLRSRQKVISKPESPRLSQLRQKLVGLMERQNLW